MSHKFSVIISSYNEGEWLEKTVLGVLENTDFPDFEIVVVADGCTDNSTEFLHSKDIPNVRLIELPSSVGLARARNEGAEKSTGDFLVFIDSHMKPCDANWLSEVTSQLKKKNVGVATLSIVYLEEPTRVAYIYTVKDLALEPMWLPPLDHIHIQYVPVVAGACFALRRDVFQSTGGFDSGLQKWGREDLEYSLRLWRLGYDLILSPRARIAHSWRRKRTFAVSWDQVDYNILRTSWTLCSPDFFEKVKTHLTSLRPQNVKKFLAELIMDTAFDLRRKKLNQSFSRDFDSWCKEFAALLPVLSI